MSRRWSGCAVAALLTAACASSGRGPAPVELAFDPPAPIFDLILRGGTVYDGSGGPPRVGRRRRPRRPHRRGRRPARRAAAQEIDATGLAVAPGFVNML